MDLHRSPANVQQMIEWRAEAIWSYGRTKPGRFDRKVSTRREALQQATTEVLAEVAATLTSMAGQGIDGFHPGTARLIVRMLDTGRLDPRPLHHRASALSHRRERMTVEIGSLDDLRLESEACECGEWFCLSGVDGRIYSLGQCADFEEADEKAGERNLESVWLASPFIAQRWREALAIPVSQDPVAVAYRTAAQDRQRDGEIEIDADAAVSLGDDPGAYVQAWIWIPEEEAGLGPREIICNRCGDRTNDRDSPDGEQCPDCHEENPA
jgi:hypothetical protein